MTTTTRLNASMQLSARWRSMGFPAMGCSALGRADLMRVPSPAASRTAVIGRGAGAAVMQVA